MIINSISHEESAHKLLSLKIDKDEKYLIADIILELCLK